jgi:hypothetical protein
MNVFEMECLVGENIQGARFTVSQSPGLPLLAIFADACWLIILGLMFCHMSHGLFAISLCTVGDYYIAFLLT